MSTVTVLTTAVDLLNGVVVKGNKTVTTQDREKKLIVVSSFNHLLPGVLKNIDILKYCEMSFLRYFLQFIVKFKVKYLQPWFIFVLH